MVVVVVVAIGSSSERRVPLDAGGNQVSTQPAVVGSGLVVGRAEGEADTQTGRLAAEWQSRQTVPVWRGVSSSSAEPPH